jgi:hypothetical protein
MRLRGLAALLVAVLAAPAARAGLYYSGEQIAPLPSQWRGFLLDQRLLRTIAVKPTKTSPPNPTRDRYREAADKLEAIKRERKLTADEIADLGALYVRLSEAAKAVEILRAAQRDFPNHFAIAANLGSAWQMQGDLAQAAVALEQAVKLAPGKLQRAEEYHLKLVRFRHKTNKPGQLDDLFGVRYVGASGKFEAGKLAEAEQKKLPADAAAHLQQLALWLPADGALLWQMGELAGALGDVRTAAAMMDGCVTEFGLADPELRAHRRAYRAAAEALGQATKTEHEGHAGLAARSKRPLLSKFGTAELPAINDKGVNLLPWTIVAETTIDKKYKPSFAKYLKELDGKQVTLTGYMQPLGDDAEPSSFMFIEYPVGCWYCEMPEITNIILVELPAGKTVGLTREALKITGTLKLNDKDPENFIYCIGKAKVTEQK